jgi:hypothetical protein
MLASYASALVRTPQKIVEDLFDFVRNPESPEKPAATRVQAKTGLAADGRTLWHVEGTKGKGRWERTNLRRRIPRSSKPCIINGLETPQWRTANPILPFSLVAVSAHCCPLGQFCRCLGKDLRVLVDVHRSRVRAHQGHIVEGRQQHVTVQCVEVQEAL